MIKKIIVGSLFISLLGLGIFYAIDYKLKTDTRLSELTNTIAVQEETINEHVASLEELRALKLTVETERDNALETLETRTAERDAEIELKNQALLQKSLLSEDVVRLNNVLHLLNDQIALVETERDNALAVNAENVELISNLQNNLTQLQNEKSIVESELETAQNTISILEGQIASFETSIVEKNNEIAGLNGQIENLNMSLSDLQVQVSSAENLIRFITFEHDSNSFISIEENILNLQSLNELFSNFQIFNIKYEVSLNSTVLQVNTPSFDLTNYLVEGTNEISIKPYLTYENVNYFDSTVIKTLAKHIQMSIAEALSAENGTLIEVTGVVTGKYDSMTNDTRYNSLYIADDTGEIVIYEISANWIDIEIGDVISAKGAKTVYQGLHEIQHASIITDVQENIIPIARQNVWSFINMFQKQPQRVKFVATVLSFASDFEVVLSFYDADVNINIRLEDSRNLTEIFEIGKSYFISAHVHTASSTKKLLIVQSLEDIIEISFEENENLIIPSSFYGNWKCDELNGNLYFDSSSIWGDGFGEFLDFIVINNIVIGYRDNSILFLPFELINDEIIVGTYHYYKLNN